MTLFDGKPLADRAPTTTRDRSVKDHSYCSDCERVVARMRELAGRKWESQGATCRNLHARHRQHSVKACLTVVENMRKWIGDERMHDFFRPTTLFRPTHFDEYLNMTPLKREDHLSDAIQKTFEITCTGCASAWRRTVWVDRQHQLTTVMWSRKLADEAFASAHIGDGDACHCYGDVHLKVV